MNKKIILGLVLILILANVVLALTKPIAGKINSENLPSSLEIKVYVEVDSPLGKNICKINPSEQSGNDGSFSTNLENLVLNDFPSVKCNSYWQKDDPIWYTAKKDNQIYTSNKTKITSGTGLQMLPSINIPTPPNIPSTTPSTGGAGSSGGGGGGSGENRKTNNNNNDLQNPQIITKPTTPKIDYIPNNIDNNIINHPNNNPQTTNNNPTSTTTSEPTLSLQLPSRENPNYFNININTNTNILLKIILTNKNKNIIHQWEKNISSQEPNHKFSLNDLDSGWYQLQAYSYNNNQLIAVSYPVEFFIKKQSWISTLSNFNKVNLNPLAIMTISYSLSMILLFVALTVHLGRKIQKRKHQPIKS